MQTIAEKHWKEDIHATCPNCHSPLPSEAKFCPECGARIQREAHCANCGAKLPIGAKFCPECGDPVNA